jgi:hypothetical protein
MGGEIAGVGGGAVEKRRFAAAQERQADHVHAGRGDDPAVVADPALAVEDRDLKPRVVGPVAGP